MAETLWIRQDTSELTEEWLFFLPAGARIAWQYLKCYVQEASTSQKRPGRAIALSSRVAAQRWNLDEGDVETMLAAAQAQGELVCKDGEWVCIDLSAFVSQRTLDKICPQNTAKRGKGSRATPTPTTTTPSLRSGDGGAVVESDPSPPPEAAKPGEGKYEQVRQVLVDVCEWLDWPEPVVADVRRNLNAKGGLLDLLGIVGHDMAVRMFVHAYSAWKGSCSWEAVFRQRNSLMDQMNGKSPPSDQPVTAVDMATRALEKHGLKVAQ